MRFPDGKYLGEEVLQRNERCGEYSLVGVDWVATLVFFKRGKMVVNATLDCAGMGSELPLRFLEEYRSCLQTGQMFENFHYRGITILTVSVADTERYHLMNLYARREGLFDERDIRWIKMMAQTNIQISTLYEDLFRKQEYINITFNSLTSLILVFDVQGNIQLSNDAAARVFGLNFDDPLSPKKLKDILPSSVWASVEKGIRQISDGQGQGQVVDRPDLIDDPRFKTVRDYAVPRNKADFIHIMDEEFAKRPAAEWVERLEKADVVYEVLAHFKDLFTNEQAEASHYISDHVMPSGNTCRMISPPLSSAQNGPVGTFIGAGLGEHTEEVLTGLGYTPEQIRQMKADKIVL